MLFKFRLQSRSFLIRQLKKTPFFLPIRKVYFLIQKKGGSAPVNKNLELKSKIMMKDINQAIENTHSQDQIIFLKVR
jgi:hypothetical protein